MNRQTPQYVNCPDCHKPMKLNLDIDSLTGSRCTVWDCLNCGTEFISDFPHPDPDVIFDTINSMLGLSMPEDEFNDFVLSPTHASILGHIAAGLTLEQAINKVYQS